MAWRRHGTIVRRAAGISGKIADGNLAAESIDGIEVESFFRRYLAQHLLTGEGGAGPP